MVRGKRRDDEGAASGVIAFMIAGILFMASIVAVLATTRTTNDRDSTADATDSARFAIQANSLADILLGSPGYFRASDGTLSPLDWSNAAEFDGGTLDADRLDRLGLLDANAREPSMMDFAKFQNLRRAGYLANSADGYVNYVEAARTLGLSDAGLDFHIRAYPTLESVSDLLANAGRDNNLRVAYIGDIEVTTSSGGTASTDGLSYSPPVCTRDLATSEPYSFPKSYRITTAIHHGGAADAEPTQFTAVTTANLGGDIQVQNTNDILVAPGTTTYLVFDVPATSGRSCGEGKSVTLDLYDPVHGKLTPLQNSVTGLDTPTISHTFTTEEATATGTASPASRGLYLDTSQQAYRPTDPVIVNYDGSGMKNNDKLFLRVCKGTAECTNADAVFRHPNAGGTFVAPNKATDRIVSVGVLGIPDGAHADFAAGDGAIPGFTDGSEYARYTAWLYDCETDSSLCSGALGTGKNILRATETILVTADEIGGYIPPGATASATSYSAPEGPAREVLFLETLMTKFCPTWFNSETKSPISGPSGPWAKADWDARCNSSDVDQFKTQPSVQSQPGDVFPDTKKVMNQDLPDRLLCQAATCLGAGITGLPVSNGQPRYDLTSVLVVGSGVDHNAMTSQSAKGTIEKWVHGGGTIIAFGSDDGNVNWLQPLFHSAIAGGGGAISTPDQGHPMLHTPNELDNPADNYDADEFVWKFNGQTALAQDQEDTAVFSNVIVVEGDETSGDPLLALSNKGSFGAGTIIITAYMAHDLYGDDDDPLGKGGQLMDANCMGPHSGAGPSRTLRECEGLKFMHNLLMQGYADLYLDYGPPIPANANVQPSQRLAQIMHPQFAEPIELTMIVYVFRSV